MPDDFAPAPYALSAPDLETVLDIEGALEPAIQRLLLDQQIDQVALRRGVRPITSRRVDVEVALGQGNESLYVPRNLPDDLVDSRRCFERAWQAQIALIVVTARDENDVFHQFYRARVRAVMLQYFTLFTPDVLPYHALSLVRSAGTHCYLQTNKDEDYSRLDYSCLVSVRDTAWPAPY